MTTGQWFPPRPEGHAARHGAMRRPPAPVSSRPLEVIIVGTNPRGEALARRIESDASSRMTVLGFVSTWTDRVPHDVSPATPVLGDLEKFDLVLSHHRTDGVIFAVPRRMIPDIEWAVNLCAEMGIKYWIAGDLFSHGTGRVAVETVAGWPLVTHEPTGQRPRDVVLKRWFDLVFASAVLVVCAPLLLVIAGLIRATSGSPVLFVQERSGLNGRPFRMLKFRTMTHGAERARADLSERNEMTGPVFKMERDPRMTVIGRYLRKYCLDELPQLINVLRGEMSVVGPRPPLPSEVAEYGPWQQRRLSMRPGLTGTWQVSGPNRNTISFDEWAAMDLEYIDRWSFSSDLGVILRTIPAVLGGTGR